MDNNIIDTNGKSINKPVHYQYDGVKCKDLLKYFVQDEQGVSAYYIGNVIKYIFRRNLKNQKASDINKAITYLEMYLKEYTKMTKEVSKERLNELDR